MNNIKNGDYIWEKWGRGYYFNGKNYPGVGSILNETMTDSKKKGLENWRKRIGHDEADKISKESRDKGTRWHAFLDLFVQKRYLDAQRLLFADESLQLFYGQAKNFLLQFAKVVEQVTTEQSIYSDVYEYAGTFDCLAIAKQETILLDWKTSRSKKIEGYVLDYYLQVAAYSTAIEEMKGIKIDRATIIVFYDFLPPDVFKLSREDLDFQFELFKNRLNKFDKKYRD
jgi:hypothetical protein